MLPYVDAALIRVKLNDSKTVPSSKLQKNLKFLKIQKLLNSYIFLDLTVETTISR